jgi:3-deoxy-D-manno-octulosonic-acid transferase
LPRVERRGGAGPLLRGFLIDLLWLPAGLLLLPFIAILVLVRRRGVGSLGERLGGWRIAPPGAGAKRIWVHCVSVGELQAAGPLLEELARARPRAERVLSVTTTTALEVARARYPGIPTFLYPLDLSLVVRRVLRRVRPDAIVLIELEVWPQLVLECASHAIPVIIANGRISDRGARRLGAVRALVRPVFRRIAEVHARDAVCAERFVAAGVPRERVLELGNLKLDRAPLPDPAAIRRRYEAAFGYPADALRWVAGCTHPGEEEIVLAAHRELRERRPDLSLLIAPRHIERAGAVEALVRSFGFTSGRESAPRPDAPEVVLLDRTGALAELYAAGDAAFVGGSLVAHGGHNVLEPVLAGTATLTGPHTGNFRDLVAPLAAAGGVEIVTAEGLAGALGGLLDDPRRRGVRIARARGAIEGSRGAAGRSAKRIAERLGG